MVSNGNPTSRQPPELNLANDAILAAITEADREYTALFDFQERRGRRAREKRAMQISHQQARMDDLNVKPAQRQQNAEYRQSQISELMQDHEREAMYEEEMECRRGLWLMLIEEEDRQTTWERAVKAQECKKGLIARGLAYDLRGHDAARIVGLAWCFMDEPAVVGQALMELSLALLLPTIRSSGGAPPLQQCEAARRAGVAALLVEAMARYQTEAFVQEQATNAVHRLCSWSLCGQDLLRLGAFQALLRSFRMAVGPIATPLRLSIARALDALYSSTVGQGGDQWRRPVEEEEEAMRALCDFLVSQPGKAQVVEACCQALVMLAVNRPSHLSWLFLPPMASTNSLGFQSILRRLLREYRSFDSRRPRAENAAVITACYRLLTAVTEGAEDSLVRELFTPALAEDLKTAHEGHFKDPICQLAYAQLWESFCSKRAHVIMVALLHDEAVTNLASCFMASIKALTRIHVIQYKYLSAMMHLFTIKPAATAQGLLRAEGVGHLSLTVTLERCFSEGAADLVLLNRLLAATLLFTQDFRFLSAVTRDESSLPQVVHKSLGLHPDVADTQLLGRKLLGRLTTSKE